MLRYVARRVLGAAVVVWAVLTTTFVALHAAPGQPAVLYASPTVTPAQQTALTHALGLDRSPAEQYIIWMQRTIRGNWGTSLNLGRPVTEIILEHLPATMLLGFASLATALAGGILLGVTAALRAGSVADLLLRFAGLVVYSMPTFWLGLVAITLLSYHFQLFPTGHMQAIGYRSLPWPSRAADALHHLTLPALVVGASLAPAIGRLTRTRLLDTLGEPFVLAARARGLSPARILLRHVLPQALAPAAQVAGLSLPMLAGGVLVTEVVFSWPGMGRLMHLALTTRDYPVVLGATAVTAIAVALGSLLADLAHAALDPHVRFRASR